MENVGDYAITAAICLELFWSFGMVFGNCELGHWIAKAYEQIDYEIGQFDWYSFPVNMLRMLPTLIIGAQQPVGINVLGIISCSREDFKKVNWIRGHQESSFLDGNTISKWFENWSFFRLSTQDTHTLCYFVNLKTNFSN